MGDRDTLVRIACKPMADNAREPNSFDEILALRETIVASLGPINENARRAAEQLASQLRISVGPAAISALARVRTITDDVAEQLRETWLSALPTNWRDLTTDEITAAVDLALDTGIAVVWVPRPDIIRVLLTADDTPAREQVLIAHDDEILDDLTAALAEVTHPDLQHLPTAAEQAINAYRDGHHGPAQSHAAATLSGIVHRHFAYRKFADARVRFERDHPDDVGLAQLRMTTLLRVFGRTITHTKYAQPGFNRHATLHEIPGDQHTPAHALTALLLLVGLLRELDEWFTRRDAQNAIT